MSPARPLLFASLLAAATSLGLLHAQQPAPAASAAPQPPPRGRVSPHETVGLRIDNNRVTVIYGRPYSKDPRSSELRKVWGSLVPYDEVWRTGADESTLLVTQQPLDFGGKVVPAGAYSLYTLLAADGSAQLLINRRIGQWGTDPYDESQELARIPLTRENLAERVDQFTIALERNPAGGGFLRLIWENTQYTAAFTVQK